MKRFQVSVLVEKGLTSILSNLDLTRCQESVRILVKLFFSSIFFIVSIFHPQSLKKHIKIMCYYAYYGIIIFKIKELLNSFSNNDFVSATKSTSLTLR